MADVDLCEAYAYCRWADKHLCGAVSGGPSAYTDYAKPDKSAWFHACSQNGAKAFPYGAAYIPAACNGADTGKHAPLAAGQQGNCIGGLPALFDMSGNVWEWEDSCDSDAPDAQCRIRGGSFDNGGAPLGCASDSALPRATRAPSVGLRD